MLMFSITRKCLSLELSHIQRDLEALNEAMAEGSDTLLIVISHSFIKPKAFRLLAQNCKAQLFFENHNIPIPHQTIRKRAEPRRRLSAYYEEGYKHGVLKFKNTKNDWT